MSIRSSLGRMFDTRLLDATMIKSQHQTNLQRNINKVERVLKNKKKKNRASANKKDKKNKKILQANGLKRDA